MQALEEVVREASPAVVFLDEALIPVGLGFRVWGLGFRIKGLGFRV